jgi:hypothetical protein
MTKETDSYSYEITLRAVGQALEALGVESFELVLDGDNFVVYGGPPKRNRFHADCILGDYRESALFAWLRAVRPSLL